MSSESFAAFRKHSGADLAALAEDHFKHDLQESDRQALRSASSTLSTHATVGSLIGLALGVALAVRVRSTRASWFQAFRAMEKPTHVQFADGRTEAIPDLTSLLKPSTLGDIAAYTFFSAGGLFLGGETGFLTGTWRASRTISEDPECRKRIETAFRRFRADVLRREADLIEKGTHTPGPLGL